MESNVITAQWFEVGVRYDKTMDDGLQKKVTEQYIVDALSFTEAEEKITEEMCQYISGDFKITSSKIATYNEVILNGGDTFFKCKVALLIIDEKTGKEKIEPHTVMVREEKFIDALHAVEKYYEVSTDDWKFLDLQETKLVDIIVDKKNQEECHAEKD